MKVCSLFSGMGGFETGVFQAYGKEKVEVVFASEIDKYATQSYEILYGHRPHGDITQVHEKDVPDHDLLVAGFPCQSFSVSGKRLGFADTRGTLFFEIARIAKEKQPKMMLLENVKGLIGHDKGRTLDVIAETLGEIGYKIDFEVMNSKYFDVAQNRERIFIICMRDVKEEKWEIGKEKNVVNNAKRRIQKLEKVKTFNFEFPKQNQVTKVLKDILEKEVDEKYYLTSERKKQLVLREINEERDIKKIGYIKKDKEQYRVHSTDGIMPTLTANNSGGRSPGGLILEGVKNNNLIQVGHIEKNKQGNRVYSVEGISPTVCSQGGGLAGSGGGLILLDEKEKEFLESEIQHLVSKTRPNEQISIKFKTNGDIRPHRNDIKKSGISELNINHENNPSHTVTASHAPKVYGLLTSLRIRRLTPLECFRLQGFPEEYFYQLKENISDSQLYKMAGNAVTTTVIRDLVIHMKDQKK